MNNSLSIRSSGVLRLLMLLAIAWIVSSVLFTHESFAQSNSTSGGFFAQPDTTNGGGLMYGILQYMRWVFSLLYVVSVYYLIKAAKSYSEENYDKMWAQIGATVFYAIIPTIAHLIWYIGGKANSQTNGSNTLFG